MATLQSGIPAGLLRIVEKGATISSATVPLTDEIFDAAVKSTKTGEVAKVDLVSSDDRIVSYVDLLGTKTLMKQVQDQAQAQDTYDKLMAIGRFFETCIEECLKSVSEETHRIISDSYVTSVPKEPGSFAALIRSIARFQRGCLLKYEELARGGIAMGKMVICDDMMIGEAFVAAHLLESNIASYPRVVINSNIPKDEFLQNVPIAHDKDGMDYVSFLSGADEGELNAAKKIVCLKKQEKSDALDLHDRLKWEWVLTYIDQVINGNECCCEHHKEVCV